MAPPQPEWSADSFFHNNVELAETIFLLLPLRRLLLLRRVSRRFSEIMNGSPKINIALWLRAPHAAPRLYFCDVLDPVTRAPIPGATAWRTQSLQVRTPILNPFMAVCVSLSIFAAAFAADITELPICAARPAC